MLLVTCVVSNFQHALQIIISKVVAELQVRAIVVCNWHDKSAQQYLASLVRKLAIFDDSHETMIIWPEPKQVPATRLALESRKFADVRFL